MKLQFFMASLALCLVAQSAFADLVITEVAGTPGGTNPVLAGQDWWELTNTGPSAALLDGFEWVDRPVDNNATAVFPNGISVASGESIIVLRGTSTLAAGAASTETHFRTDWGLAPSVQILTQDQFTGVTTFSGLGGSSELIHLYDGPPPTLGTANLLASAPTGGAGVGRTHEWGTNTGGTLGRLSANGLNGAFTTLDGQVGSPGSATVSNLGGAFTVFSDTFDVSDPLLTVVDDELAYPRQVFSTSDYNELGPAVIGHDAFGPGDDGLVFNTSAAAAGAVVNLREDFGPTLTGGKYSFSYEGRIDVTAGATADHWQGFSMGDTATNSVNGTNTDFGILFKTNGDWSLFLDGNLAVGSGIGDLGIDSGIRAGSLYDVEILVDETGASPAVTVTANATLGSVLLGTIPIDAFGPGTGFDSAGRFFELRAFLDGANAGTDLFDHHINNLTINMIPEPTTGVMFSLACLICAVGRRAKR